MTSMPAGRKVVSLGLPEVYFVHRGACYFSIYFILAYLHSDHDRDKVHRLIAYYSP